MIYLRGDSNIIFERIKKLEEKPPNEWEKCECINDEFREKYFWFKYFGDRYPELFLYIPRKSYEKNKVFFKILPAKNEDRDLIENKCVDIANNIFSIVIDNKIVLEGD